MQKFVSLLIVMAILYMVFQHQANTMQLPINPTNATDNKVTSADSNKNNSPEVTGNFVEKTLSNVLINVLKSEEGRMFFESIVTPADKPIAGSGKGYKLNNNNLINNMFQVNTFGDGIEGPVSCGHIVTVRYKILNVNNAVLEEKTETFPLGTKKDVPGLDAIIVGMKTGQTRQATILAKYVSQEEKFANASFKLSVDLMDVIPKNFIGNDVKIFDDEIAYELPLFCGQTAVFDAKITKLTNGEVVYDSNTSGTKINMQIGNGIYPVIFSHALHNKIPTGTRTVIAKGKLFKSFATKNSAIFKEEVLPEEEYFMLELMNFESLVNK